MKEVNLCHKIGCKAECCANILGHMPGSTEFFLKAFPDAIKIEHGDTEILKKKIKDRETGVYYYQEHGWVYFGISGACPNLSEEGNCNIHEERFYPRPCINMESESRGCLDSRYIYKVNSEVLKRIDSSN